MTGSSMGSKLSPMLFYWFDEKNNYRSSKNLAGLCCVVVVVSLRRATANNLYREKREKEVTPRRLAPPPPPLHSMRKQSTRKKDRRAPTDCREGTTSESRVATTACPCRSSATSSQGPGAMVDIDHANCRLQDHADSICAQSVARSRRRPARKAEATPARKFASAPFEFPSTPQ
ncbi:hypothetical protein Mapa_010323 [Marchantia paleacea]|nr:hypothetical protein Mapa_010323 [Marchantia paleacea]